MIANRKPRVLIGIPTYVGKNYCLREFVRHLGQVATDGFDIDYLWVDNTDDNGENAEFLRGYTGHRVYHLVCKTKIINGKLAETHNLLLEAALANKFDYLLHIESDVLVPNITLQSLYTANKLQCSGWYMIGNGATRFPIHNWWLPGIVHFQQNLRLCWRHKIHPGVQEVGNVGVGCTLIHKNILSKVKFRYEPGLSMAPDSFLSTDLENLHIKTFVDNRVHCFHANDLGWGLTADITEKLTGYGTDI